MNKFQEIHKLSQLTSEEIDNINRLIRNRETDSVIINLSMKKNPGQDGITDEFYQAFK